MLMAAATAVSGRAAEYEVTGNIRETIVQNGNRGDLCCTNGFTVFVRDGAWLIRTFETNTIGAVMKREFGSTNGRDIYGITVSSQPAAPANPAGTNSPGPANVRRPQPYNLAEITTTGIPVGNLDKDMHAHLWLMFASQSYWTHLTTNRLTPVYNFNAAAPLNPNLTVEGTWDLLGGPGSLPREARYLGQWGETNGLYRVTGTNLVGGVLIPSSFFFEERHVGPIEGDSLVHSMALRKRVDAVVTSVKPVCSLTNLLPVMEERTIIIDRRLAGSLPDYLNPTPGKWPSVQEAGPLAADRQAQQARGRAEAQRLAPARQGQPTNAEPDIR
jgi:hypothetical protein